MYSMYIYICKYGSVICVTSESDSMCSSSILSAPPTAELEPLTDGQVSQTDEVSKCLHYGVAILSLCHNDLYNKIIMEWQH